MRSTTTYVALMAASITRHVNAQSSRSVAKPSHGSTLLTTFQYLPACKHGHLHICVYCDSRRDRGSSPSYHHYRHRDFARRQRRSKQSIGIPHLHLSAGCNDYDDYIRLLEQHLSDTELLDIASNVRIPSGYSISRTGVCGVEQHCCVADVKSNRDSDRSF